MGETQRPGGRERGVGDSLRAAIERTLQATAGPAATTRDRAAELLDEVARLGGEARDEIARRGGEARDELARRGTEARGEVARRLEALERRLEQLESKLGQAKGDGDGDIKPQAED